MLKKNFPMGNCLENSPFYSSGLSVYEEGDKVIIEEVLLDVKLEDIEVSQTHGFIFIEGEKKKKKRKYYTATHSFSYRTLIPPDP